MKHIVFSILSIIVLSGFVSAGELIATKSKDVTSKDIPLKFVLEKTTWEIGNVYVWGTVKNTSKDKKYKNVKVIFTAKDSKNAFIGRHTWYIDPQDVAPGQVGYIEKNHIQCEERKPAKIEYSVIGDEEK